jgi:hypothetical protein
MEVDEALKPVKVGVLGADAVLLDADPVANTVKQVRTVHPSNDRLWSHYRNLPV